MGSAEGILEVMTEKLGFAVSDIDLTSANFAQAPDLQQIPMLVSAVVLVVNLPTLVSQVQMTWSREAIVSVMNGSMTHWNDPQLRHLNPFISLPGVPITIAVLTKYTSV